MYTLHYWYLDNKTLEFFTKEISADTCRDLMRKDTEFRMHHDLSKYTIPTFALITNSEEDEEITKAISTGRV